jgi:hypothetical protein
MNRYFASLTVFALVVSLAGSVLAKDSGEGGCSKCNKEAQQNPVAGGSTAAAEPERTRQFMLNTLDLRREMMNMRFDVQRENLSATPDAAKVAALKAGIESIQARISAIRLQSGLADEGMRDGECFKMDGGCGKSGKPGGCDRVPCGMK